MLNYDVLSRKPLNFRSFTCLEVPEFDSVYARLLEVTPITEERRLWREDRKNRMGAGHPFKLPLRDRLLMLLVYYRLYVTSTLAGFLFDLAQSNVLKNIRMLEPAVKMTLPLPRRLHDRARRLRTLGEVEEVFPGFRAYLDATEQEIPRPREKRRRRTHYSGKARRHTVKTQVTVNGRGLIVHKSPHAAGRRHDYDVYKGSRPHLPKEVRLGVDLGYDGIRSDYPDQLVDIPFKRRSPGRGKRGVKAKPLTPEQRMHNRALSRARVVVEHSISRLKKHRIMGEEFRNRLRHYDEATDIVSGLVNLRILGSLAV